MHSVQMKNSATLLNKIATDYTNSHKSDSYYVSITCGFSSFAFTEKSIKIRVHLCNL